MAAQIKFHAAVQKGASLWVACGTFKNAKFDAHSGFTTVADFKTLAPEMQCKKCAAKIAALKL